MDDTIKTNLISQANQLNELDSLLEELSESSIDDELEELQARSKSIKQLLEAGGEKVPELKSESVDQQENIYSLSAKTYEQVTNENLDYLSDHGLLDQEFKSLFSDDDLARIERELSAPIKREHWDKWDMVAVLAGGIAGTTADFFTDGIDGQLKDWLSQFKIDSKKVSIDYQGPGFGGGFHRGLSSGHDILRVFSAIWQIKNGTFIGLKQTRDGFEWVRTTSNQYGKQFETYGGLESILIWIKHELSDFITPASLPFPGMSYLMEMPDHEIRKFTIQLYQSGYNLRYILVQALAPALVELIVRGYILGREYKDTGQITFPSAKRLKNTEMLLASHAMVMAINCGKVVVRANAEGPLALKNLNIPQIIATVRYFIPFVVKRMRLNDPVEIIKRNAQLITEGYDSLLAELRQKMVEDGDFQEFLNDGNQIIV